MKFPMFVAYILLGIFMSVSLAFAMEEVGSAFEGSLLVDTGSGGIRPDNGTGNQAFCGNGIVEQGEQCDGDLQGQSCNSIVGNGSIGVLSCTAQCTWDTSLCSQPSVPNETTDLGNTGGTNGGGGGGGGGGSSGGSSSGVRLTFFNNQTGNASIPIGNTNGQVLENGEEQQLSSTNSTESQGGGSGITGAVIGALRRGGFIPLAIFIIIVAAAFAALQFRKGAEKKSFPKE